MKTMAPFNFSEEQFQTWMRDLLDWGASENLNPAELCLVMGMVAGFLQTKLGLDIHGAQDDRGTLQ
jgi:hypothetical protein